MTLVSVLSDFGQFFDVAPFLIHSGIDNCTPTSNPQKKPPLSGTAFFVLTKIPPHTLISTSTPEGSSSFISASTVFELDE